MALNLGYIEGTVAGGDVAVRVYYDATQPAGPSQPLINGARGFCLDVTNITGRRARVTVDGLDLQRTEFSVAQGNPVTAGVSRSRTRAQVSQLGWTTRGDVANFALSDD